MYLVYAFNFDGKRIFYNRDGSTEKRAGNADLLTWREAAELRAALPGEMAHILDENDVLTIERDGVE